MCAECLAAEVALEGFLSSVGTEVHVEVGLLGEGVVAELTHVGPLVPADQPGREGVEGRRKREREREKENSHSWTHLLIAKTQKKRKARGSLHTCAWL